jgi:heme/copper-type cytochrome/quinol oxidase subunit 4
MTVDEIISIIIIITVVVVVLWDMYKKEEHDIEE